MVNVGKVSRRGFLLAGGATASSTILAGCSSNGTDGTTSDSPTAEAGGKDTEGTAKPTDTPGETTEPPQQQNEMTYRRMTTGVRTMDPIAASDIPALEMVQNLFDCLTNFPNGETAVESLLLDSYESKKSGKQYVFHLKEGMTYTNGDEVTAQDFVYSWERLAYAEKSQRADFLLGFLGVKHETDNKGNYKANSLGVKAHDDYTLEVNLERPFHAVLELLAYDSFAAIPEGIVGDVKGYDGQMSQADFAMDPVGAGPFELDEWKKDTEIRIKARPIDEYHGPGPYISAVQWTVARGTNAIYTYATRNVNADHPAIPSSKYDPKKIKVEGTDSRGREYGTYGPMANDLTADYYNLPILATYYFGFNCNSVIKPARKAWAYVYNRPQINEKVSSGPSSPAYFFSPPSLFPGGPESYHKKKKEYPYGLGETKIDKARQVMEDAGYSENNEYKMEYTTADAESYKEEGRIIRDRLKSAHIDMTIQTDTLSTRFDKIANGNIDAYVLSWWADYPAADNFLQMLYPPNTNIKNDFSLNGFNWYDTKVSKKAKKAWKTIQNNLAATESAKKKRNEAYLKIEKARWEGLPVVTSNHYVVEKYKYPWVKKPRSGAMGGERQKFNKVRLEDRSQYM